MPELLYYTVCFIAQGGDGAAGAGQAAQPNPLFQLVFMGSLIMMMFYFMMIRPRQKQERAHRDMLAALKKNDHVETSGGIKGVVAVVKPEDKEVVLRIDDASGAKLRVAMWSIARVIGSEGDAATTKKESS
jgi:preprotein translocase subunit YajC